MTEPTNNNPVQIFNATITDTMLGYNSGVLMSNLFINFNGLQATFGGVRLDDVAQNSDGSRMIVPHALCGFWLSRILEVVGVARWEELNGQYIRVMVENNQVVGIGNIVLEKWFTPAKEVPMFLGQTPVIDVTMDEDAKPIPSEEQEASDDKQSEDKPETDPNA